MSADLSASMASAILDVLAANEGELGYDQLLVALRDGGATGSNTLAVLERLEREGRIGKRWAGKRDFEGIELPVDLRVWLT